MARKKDGKLGLNVFLPRVLGRFVRYFLDYYFATRGAMGREVKLIVLWLLACKIGPWPPP